MNERGNIKVEAKLTERPNLSVGRYPFIAYNEQRFEQTNIIYGQYIDDDLFVTEHNVIAPKSISFLYVATSGDDASFYRYDGEKYVKIKMSSLQLGTTETTAHRGDHGKHAYDAVIETEETDFSKEIIDNVNF